MSIHVTKTIRDAVAALLEGSTSAAKVESFRFSAATAFPHISIYTDSDEALETGTSVGTTEARNLTLSTEIRIKEPANVDLELDRLRFEIEAAMYNSFVNGGTLGDLLFALQFASAETERGINKDDYAAVMVINWRAWYRVDALNPSVVVM